VLSRLLTFSSATTPTICQATSGPAALARDDLLDQDVLADRVLRRELAARERLVDDDDGSRPLVSASERPRPLRSFMPSAPK
jgi:hypothetical protein